MNELPHDEAIALPAARRLPWGRICLLAALLAAAVFLVHLTPLCDLVKEWRTPQPKLAQYGWAGPLVFIGLSALLIAVGFPRLVLCSIAGLAFGFVRGLIWSEIATVVGSYAMFCFVRWAGREMVLLRWPWLNRYAQALGKGAWSTVLISRLLPISGLLVNATLALTTVRHRDFLLASAIGFLPEAIPAVLAGAGIGQNSLGRGIGFGLIAVVLMLAAGFAVKRYRKSSAVKEMDLPASQPMEKQNGTVKG